MVEIPENEVTMQDLFTWYAMKDQLNKLKAAEMLLRTKIAKAKFPTPVEGTNKVALPDGYVLKMVYGLNREVDPGALDAYREQFAQAHIFTDLLIKRKPELRISTYRELTEEQRQLFDNVLIIKPGSPQLEVVLPKRAAK